jgi:hypothetical protein
MRQLLIIFLILIAFADYSSAKEFHTALDSLIRQKSGGSVQTIKSNCKNNLVILFYNGLVEVRDKDTNLIKLDVYKSQLHDIHYDDNGDIYVTDTYKNYEFSQFKKYNGTGWDTIYDSPKSQGNSNQEELRSIAKDDKGNYWLNVMRMYFIKCDGKNCTKFYGKDTLDVYKDQDYYPNLYGFNENLVFYKGNLFYFGLNGDLCSINTITGERKLYDEALYKKNNGLGMFPKLRLANDNLWMIQPEGNLTSFDGSDFTTHHLDEGSISNVFTGNVYFSFDVDKDSSVWISGSFHFKDIDSNRVAILHYYSPSNFKFYKMNYLGFDKYTTVQPIKCLPNGSTVFYISGGNADSKILYWGDEDQSPIVSVENKHQFNVSLAYPNPLKDKVTLQFEANSSLDIRQATVDVYDYMGQLIKSSVQSGSIFNSSEGKGKIYADLTGIQRGFYVLILNVNGDKEIYPIMKE